MNVDVKDGVNDGINVFVAVNVGVKVKDGVTELVSVAVRVWVVLGVKVKVWLGLLVNEGVKGNTGVLVEVFSGLDVLVLVPVTGINVLVAVCSDTTVLAAVAERALILVIVGLDTRILVG